MSGLAPVDYTGISVDKVGSWLIRNVPNGDAKEVTFVVSLNDRKIAVKLSTKKEYPDSVLKDAIPFLYEESKKELLRTVNPKLECLTDDEETINLAKAIGEYIYTNKPMYTGALIYAHRLSVGHINIGRA